jgi:hypothetical protein
MPTTNNCTPQTRMSAICHGMDAECGNLINADHNRQTDPCSIENNMSNLLSATRHRTRVAQGEYGWVHMTTIVHFSEPSR